MAIKRMRIEGSARVTVFIHCAILVVALATLGSVIGYFQFEEYRRIDTQERERLATQAETVEKNLVPQLLLANRVIDGIINDLPSWRAERDGFKRGNRELQVINDTLAGIRPILVIQADGTVIASSNGKLIGMNFSYRDYFKTALKNPDPRILHVSAPFKTVLDTFVISLFRAFPGPHGEFGGIVIVSVIPEYFSALLESVLYAPDMRVSIVHGDGRVFLMSPRTAQFYGADVNKPGTFFTRHLQSGQRASVFTGTSSVTGESRMIALRTIQLADPPMDKALIVLVSRDLAALLAPWRKGLYSQMTLFGVLSVCCVLGLFLFERRQRDQRLERKKANEKIEELAYFDQLTGLPNRILLVQRLNDAMAASAMSTRYGAILFIDLDHFKNLNDTLGHNMGDRLLKQVAQRLCKCVRTSDTVARLGGDEFVVQLSDLSSDQQDAAAIVETVGKKILLDLNEAYRLNDVSYRSTPSIGATLFCGQLASVDDVLKQADLAMYKSKSVGRNTMSFFDPAMESAMLRHAALETDLRRAIAENQLLLHYQGQVVDEGRLTGCEALVRWNHPIRGMISPVEFIPLAEETGLILPLGEWVLETACKQLAAWAVRSEMANLAIAVNVSTLQFSQVDFVDRVLAVIHSTGANPRRLKLEMTESLLISNVESVIEKMFALRAKGVGFALDDFGTGYSSLAYLKLLPLDQLKIDQSFVRDVLNDPNDASIAKTIIALARGLGIGVIAEGVETAAQRDFLADSGCHAYQGYFFTRPLPIDDFEEYAQLQNSPLSSLYAGVSGTPLKLLERKLEGAS
ncbi:MAG: EAL domain-containing protein [Burkholderiales bacterium]